MKRMWLRVLDRCEDVPALDVLVSSIHLVYEFLLMGERGYTGIHIGPTCYALHEPSHC